MELALKVRPGVAEALRSSGAMEYVLEADCYVAVQTLKWNIQKRTDAIRAEVENADPNYAKVADLAGELQALGSACERIERAELPADLGGWA